MEAYKKPMIVRDGESAQGVLPFIAAGFGLALMKGKIKVDSTHTQALTPRKDFSSN